MGECAAGGWRISTYRGKAANATFPLYAARHKFWMKTRRRAPGREAEMKRVRFGLLAALLGVWTIPAAAQDGQIPQSVFQPQADGSALHLQSLWRCPAAFGDFARNSLHVFDAAGLDVSCDYQIGGQSEITLYLTKSSGGDLTASFENAKKAMVQKPGNAGIFPLSDAEQKTFASKRNWLHAVYTGAGGKFRTGVWYAWYGDWAFEIRASYPTEQEDAVMAVLARMTEDAAQTAGNHLERCVKSQIPARDGKQVTDEDMLMQNALISGAAGAVASEKQTPAPFRWCAESLVQGIADPVLLWHGVDEKGNLLAMDQASLMTYGPPPVLESGRDDLVTTVLSETGAGKGKTFFAVTATRSDENCFFALFDGRPGGAAMAEILRGMVHNTVSPRSCINVKTKQITVYTKPDKQK
jgi:hypothetical protein